MGEEHLRDHFLVQLNGHFEGNATGETFNKSGKTNIIIRAEGRSIFIAECKFWGGEKLFLDTIDQLLGYLTWRDTKTALVIFNRNKSFSAVVTKARESIKAHPNCKRGSDAEADTVGRYVFMQKDDPARETIVTLMLFDVPLVRANRECNRARSIRQERSLAPPLHPRVLPQAMGHEGPVGGVQSALRQRRKAEAGLPARDRLREPSL
jgi:hypothetical protein